MEKVVIDESIFLKSRFFITAKRLGTALKLSTFLLAAVVAYAAFLKRQRLLVGLVSASTLLLSLLSNGASSSALAADTVVPNTHNQVFTRGKGSEHSKALRLEGTPAYVTSAKGTAYGVLIDTVDSAGLLGTVGISAGDIILKINGHTVETAKQIDRFYEDSGSSVQVSFVHTGDTGLLLYNAPLPGRTAGKVSGHSATTAAPDASHSPVVTVAQEAAQAEALMLPIINRDRAKFGVPPVRMNASLTAFARTRSADMVKRNYFNHIDPDGVSPQTKARAAGIVNGVYENISWRKGYATIFDNAAACQQSMMEEPKNQENHRSNILDPKHMTVGVGIAVSANGVVYMTEEFSRTDP
ncbi:MAG: CAP domain-containing protein [Candidatus Obscuribacterales bacterium]|nr:CAP domain-containing protein [Candidatus Obscuribacterales bacterium]